MILEDAQQIADGIIQGGIDIASPSTDPDRVKRGLLRAAISRASFTRSLMAFHALSGASACRAWFSTHTLGVSLYVVLVGCSR